MFELFWGSKTTAIMDFWTIGHLLSGLSIGYLLKKMFRNIFKNKSELLKENIIIKHFDIVVIFFLAYLWEGIEYCLEIGVVGERVQHWFQGVEFWPNRFIFDPLIFILGYIIAKKCPKLINLARFCLLVWFIMHVFVFPDSMYLYRLLG